MTLIIRPKAEKPIPLLQAAASRPATPFAKPEEVLQIPQSGMRNFHWRLRTVERDDDTPPKPSLSLFHEAIHTAPNTPSLNTPVPNRPASTPGHPVWIDRIIWYSLEANSVTESDDDSVTVDTLPELPIDELVICSTHNTPAPTPCAPDEIVFPAFRTFSEPLDLDDPETPQKPAVTTTPPSIPEAPTDRLASFITISPRLIGFRAPINLEQPLSPSSVAKPVEVSQISQTFNPLNKV